MTTGTLRRWGLQKSVPAMSMAARENRDGCGRLRDGPTPSRQLSASRRSPARGGPHPALWTAAGPGCPPDPHPPGTRTHPASDSSCSSSRSRFSAPAHWVRLIVYGRLDVTFPEYAVDDRVMAGPRDTAAAGDVQVGLRGRCSGFRSRLQTSSRDPDDRARAQRSRRFRAIGTGVCAVPPRVASFGRSAVRHVSKRGARDQSRVEVVRERYAACAAVSRGGLCARDQERAALSANSSARVLRVREAMARRSAVMSDEKPKRRRTMAAELGQLPRSLRTGVFRWRP